MKNIQLIFLIVLVGFSACCAKKKISKSNESAADSGLQKAQLFEASYVYSAEATYESVLMKNMKLKYAVLKNEKTSVVNWVDQKPVWNLEDIKVVETVVTATEIDSLLKRIDAAGFWKLDSIYGLIEPGQKYYPFDMSVTNDGIVKHVIYNSVPGKTQMPDAFRKSRDELVRFARQKTKGK